MLIGAIRMRVMDQHMLYYVHMSTYVGILALIY